MVTVSIIIPALNEEKTIGICVRKAFDAFAASGISGEVIVADNGSTDRTRETCLALGARVEPVGKKGYGYACMAGMTAAKGKYLVMADADDSYNFEEIGPFLKKLAEGYDFVMGNRFQGKIEKRAMPFLHYWLGTPVLTFLSNLFFGTGIGDVNCGMRGLTKNGFERMRLKAGGMEFATEMIVKASLLKIKTAEVPCNLYCDKRERKPHLRTWRDGWRHLRFMLLFAPTWTFLVPGLTGCILGIITAGFIFARDIFGPGGLPFLNQKHMLSAMLLVLTGCQLIEFGLIAQTFSFSKYFDRRNRTMRFLNRFFSLERGILCGLGLIAGGVAGLAYLGISYYGRIFYLMPDPVRFDVAVFSIAFFLIGIQLVFSSFVLSLFYLKVK